RCHYRVDSDHHSFPTRRSSDLRVGITQVSISDIERGKTESTGYIAQIAAACGVSPLWLADGRGSTLGETNVEPGPDVRGQLPLRSEEHTSELQSRENLVCRLLL